MVIRQEGAGRGLQQITSQQIADLRLAAAQMSGAKRRAFQAEMVEKYCAGNARQAERMFGWKRATVEVGLAEHRTEDTSLHSRSRDRRP